MVPTLTTARLVLRPWRESDLDVIATYEADPVAMRYIGDGSVHSREHAAATIAGFEAEWERCGHGRWAVEVRESGQLAGSCGFVRWLEGQPGQRPELAYGYARQHWGQGIAVEAGRAALEWAFATLPFNEIVALTHPENAASQRVLEKLGFTPAGEVQGRFQTMFFFRLPRRGFPGAATASV